MSASTCIKNRLFFNFVIGLFIILQQINFGISYQLQYTVDDAFPLSQSNFHRNNNKKIPTPDVTNPSPRFRLPLNVIPRHYEFKQQPILETTEGFELFTSPSEVTITVLCTEQTSTITLHSDTSFISIEESLVKVSGPGNVDMGPLSHNYETENDFYIITLTNASRPLEANEEYTIYIKFTTTMSDGRFRPFGMYRALTVDPETPDEEKYMSVTTLEPHFARQVLPCFDEPDLKATFDIILGHTSNYTSLAHTPIKETELEGVWLWDHYERIPPMSTYLLCLIVVPKHYIGVNATEGLFDKQVQVWAPQHLIEQDGGEFAANVSARSLEFFQNRYLINYSLPKLDSILIPGFPAGALENWGINTYRESVLIHLPGETSQLEKGRSASTIHHEISHQWFGNLVSCKWWDDIWLNEGFANYQSFKGLDETNPEFEPNKTFTSDSVQASMRYDQSPATHPVKFETLPDDWMDIFDALSYQKGGSLIRMMEGVLTEEILIKGLQEFLEKMQYKGAEQDDLFASLDLAASSALVNPLPSGLTVKEIMDTWTLQSGYPLIRVSAAGSRRIFISQEKFSLTPLGDTKTGLWHIPVKVVSESNRDTTNMSPNTWLSINDALVSYAENINTAQWIMVNPDAFGYYRVMYDSQLLELIKAQLLDEPNEITPASRSQLLDDYWNFALGKYVDIETFLDLTKYLSKENELVVWGSVLANLRPVHTKLSETPGFLALGRYFRPRVEGALDLIGWEQMDDEVGANVVLRATLLDWACSFKSVRCFSEAERLFDAWTNPDENPIPVDVQSVYFCAAVASIGERAYNVILTRYNEAAISESLKLRLLSALACASQTELLENALEHALNEDQVRVSDRQYFLQRIATNSNGRILVYNFVKENVTLTDSQITPQIFANVISTLSSYWYNQADADQLNEFVAENEVILEPVRDTLTQAIANIAANIEWMETTGKPIVTWLNGESKKEQLNNE